MTPGSPISPFLDYITTNQKNNEETMDQEILKSLARELATRVNNAVDIPLVKEEDE